MIYDVLIVGAGVIGGMLARELSRYELSVCLLEKENDVACGASKANSGIVHGGFDPEPGTLKAKMNVEGIEKLFRTAEMLSVPVLRNGSMVVAFSAEEEPMLETLYQRGLTNGISGMSLISGEEARVMEPQLSPEITRVLLVPSAGIICPYELTIAAVGNAMDNGVTLLRNFEVSEIRKEADCFAVSSADGRTEKGRFLVNCAGCGSDRIAALAGDGFFTIIPRAGEYMLLDKTEGIRVSHTIFQVPTANGKGILVSPTVDRNLLTGPTAVRVEDGGCTETTAEGLKTVSDLSHKSVPSVDFRRVITSFSGVRASEKNGDFIIQASEKVPGLVHVAAIDSPGLTSCVAIAEYAVKELQKAGMELRPKADWNGKREDVHRFRKMKERERDEWIRENPAYGRIVCRCETVSEGEIRDVIHRNPRALDVDGVKRRIRAGMGRCQGGFCLPSVLKILAEENHAELSEITKKGGDSRLIDGKI